MKKIINIVEIKKKKKFIIFYININNFLIIINFIFII